MFHRIIVALSLVYSISAYAQNQSLLDSLWQGVRTSQTDSARLDNHYELCYQWAEYNFDSAMYHAKRMQEIADSNEQYKFTYKATSAKGLVFDYQYSFDSAIHYYGLAKSIALENDYLKGVAISTFNIGVVHYYSGEMEKAIDNYLEAEKYYLEISDQRNLAVLYNNMGIIYRNAKKYKLAKETYEKSLNIKREREDVAGIMNTLSNLSTVNYYLKDYESAREASEEVIILAEKHENKGAYLSEIINLAKIHLATEKSGLALALYEEAETLLDDNSPYTFRIHILQQLSDFYVERQELGKAEKYLLLVDESLTEEQLEVAMNHYLTSVDFYRLTLQEKKALDALQKAFEIREDLFDNEVLEKTTELEQLYEKDKRENEIAKLNAENAIQSLTLAKRRQERNGLILLSLLVVGVAALFFSLFRQKRKSLSERETLLKEIHHRVKNNLQIISSLLNLQAGSLEDEVAIEAVKEGQNRVKSMALIHENLYRNDNLSGISIDDYVDNLTTTLYSSFGIDSDKIRAELDIEKLKLDIDTLIPLGLILNELLSNSLKYAFPTGEGKLILSLSQRDDFLDLSVKDNGPGLDEEKLETSNSYGWKMVKSLSRKLKAEITINSDSGTEISLKIKNYKLVA